MRAEQITRVHSGKQTKTVQWSSELLAVHASADYNNLDSLFADIYQTQTQHVEINTKNEKQNNKHHNDQISNVQQHSIHDRAHLFCLTQNTT